MVYQIPELLKYKRLFHVFSTKADGNMSNTIAGMDIDYGNSVENRKRFLKKINIDINKTICIWVQHSDKVGIADTKLVGISMTDKNKAVKSDGLITDKKGLYLFLLIADCLPIIMFDPKKEVVGLVHAGWKGVDLEIVKRAVGSLRRQFNSKAEDLIVAIGPSVHKSSFIKESPLQKDDPRWQPYMENIDDNKYSIDLTEFTKKQLLDVGVKDKNIIVSNIDTVKDNRFFSHMRDKNLPIEKQGRFACIVAIM